MSGPDALLRKAGEVDALLRRHRLDAGVIGGVALAVNAELGPLREVLASLRAAGFAAELREPGADAPLPGVLDVHGEFGLIQIISYAGRFPAVIEDALRLSSLAVQPGSPLRIAPLPHLIALKLYAGGFKSKADIVELLVRNPEADLGAVRTTCARYRLEGIEELITEARPG
ncbi:MAG: hypothetical protein ACKOUK_11975 [Verrucomicrobiota bacterium]